MTIYTVISNDDLIDECPSIDMLGSYRTRGDALRKCAEHIIYRAGLRDDIRDLMRHDENHILPNAPLESKEVMDYLLDELGGQGGYAMYSDAVGTVRFYVEKNELAD